MKRKAHLQGTLATQTGFEKYARRSRREEFLSVMDAVVPWRELESLIEPYYPKAGNGRQPVGLSIMLRGYFLQQWFNLSDPGAEDVLYESPVLRRFAGVDLGRAAAPDETTILRFRRLLEQHELCGKILDTVNHYLANKGPRSLPRTQQAPIPSALDSQNYYLRCSLDSACGRSFPFHCFSSEMGLAS